MFEHEKPNQVMTLAVTFNPDDINTIRSFDRNAQSAQQAAQIAVQVYANQLRERFSPPLPPTPPPDVFGT